MSQENVEIVRRLLEAHRSEDIDAGVETFVALSDPTVEFTSIMAAVAPVTYRGHDGIRRYLRELATSWSEWRMEPEEVFELGNGSVFAAFRSHLVGEQSGAAVEAERAGVFVLFDGKIVSGRIYPTREQALEAAGLPE